MSEKNTAPPAAVQPESSPFQQRVQPWLMACFGEIIAGDREERNHCFLEESLELVQSCGCTASEAHQLVEYVYGRPIGDPAQEVGGVMVTLAALCLAQGLDMYGAAEAELARIWTKVEVIRSKQAAKPKYSPLPEFVQPDSERDAALPDLLWDAADPEDGAHGSSGQDFAENYASGNMVPGDVSEVTVLCATRSHTRKMLITVTDDPENWLNWEWIAMAAAAPQKKEG